MTLAVLLGLNGREIEAPEAEVVTTLLALAGDRRTEEQPASWVRSRLARTGAGEQG